MSNFGTYPKEDFSTSQNFLARNPSGSGEVIRVGGQSILDAAVVELEQSGTVVQSIDTLTEAIAFDYQSGTYVLTGGATVTIDGGQSIYRVSDPGSGGIVMDNGNELVVIYEIVTQESIASQVHGGQFMTYGGTADVITLASVNTVALTAVATGDLFRFRATAANTGATTINPDGIAAVACLTVTGVALPADYIRTDVDTVCVYDGTNYIVQREIESGSNANGEFTRFGDGTATAYRLDTSTTLYGMTTASGGAFFGDLVATLPITFSVAPPFKNASRSDGAITVPTEIASTTTTVTLRMQSNISVTTNHYIAYTATGKWY